ncbi:ATPase [Sphingomonadales bacterium EhC05]|jgi:predicted AAA+ superfamily ATPase|nr:ATPase [Sphingomonadales bacterium EhC05]
MPENSAKPILERIAEALERMSPVPPPNSDLSSNGAFQWNGQQIVPIEYFKPVEIDLLTAIDDQKSRLLTNTERHAQGFASHDVLLWGARGTGKSALVKSVVKALQNRGENIALVETTSEHLTILTDLMALLRGFERPFIIFIDDIGFEEGDATARHLRSMLEGGAAQRPANIRLYITSNRRHILPRQMNEQDDPINPRDAIDDKLALSDRFGLRLGFHAVSQDDYLSIIETYAEVHGLQFETEDALLWSKQCGARSGRVAWQYIVELAGRAGQSLD